MKTKKGRRVTQTEQQSLNSLFKNVPLVIYDKENPSNYILAARNARPEDVIIAERNHKKKFNLDQAKQVLNKALDECEGR